MQNRFMPRTAFLVLAVMLAALTDAAADDYPLSGVWAVVNPNGETVASTCAAYQKNPENPPVKSGQIVLFKGSQRTNYNAGLYEIETVKNVSVSRIRENEFLVTDCYFDDGEGDSTPGYKNRSYVLRVLSPNRFDETPTFNGSPANSVCDVSLGCEVYVRCD